MVNFVDDGTVDVADKDPEVINRKLASHYSKFENYMNANKLVINSDKSHLLVLAGRGAMSARRMDIQLHAGPDTIEQSASEKLLGRVIQNTGGWKQMIRDGQKLNSISIK